MKKTQIFIVIFTFIVFMGLGIYLNIDKKSKLKKIDNQTSNEVKKMANQTSNEVKKMDSKGGNKTKKITSDVKNEILVVEPSCIGCGKCFRIDPENFRMNYNTHKSEAKNPKNFNKSENLKRAINKCPVNAIKIKRI